MKPLFLFAALLVAGHAHAAHLDYAEATWQFDARDVLSAPVTPGAWATPDVDDVHSVQKGRVDFADAHNELAQWPVAVTDLHSLVTPAVFETAEQPISQVPVPSAFWMFASAFLVLLRRR